MGNLSAKSSVAESYGGGQGEHSDAAGSCRQIAQRCKGDDPTKGHQPE
jgi:hypothetical protein